MASSAGGASVIDRPYAGEHVPTSVISSKTANAAQEWSGLRVFARLMPLLILFWGFFFIRIHNIDGWIAYFIDEVHHIDRARRVWTFSDLQVSTTPGKFLLYYWISLFDLPVHLPGWIARAPVALFALLGAAGTYALTKTLFSRSAALLSLLLLAVFPFMTFHERMVLTDPIAAVFVVLVAWRSVLLARKPQVSSAIVLGLLLCLMLAAKLHSFPLVMLPVLAVALFSQPVIDLRHGVVGQLKRLWLKYRQALLVMGLFVGIWMAVLGIFYVARGLLDPSDTKPIVDDYIYAGLDAKFDTTVWDVIELNLIHLEELFIYLWGPLLTGVMAVVTLYLLVRQPRKALYLLLGIMALWTLVIVVAARPNSRYFTLVGHLWIVLVAGGAWSIRDDLIQSSNWAVRLLGWVPVALLIVWMMVFALPFSQQMMDDAVGLELPEKELNGYFRNVSGYGLRDALDYVAEQPPVSYGVDMPVVYSVMRECQYVPYHIPADTPLHIECYDHRFRLQEWRLHNILDIYGPVYMIRERLAEYEFQQPALKARLQWLASFRRPHDGLYVDVYLVYPAEVPIGGPRPSPDNSY